MKGEDKEIIYIYIYIFFWGDEEARKQTNRFLKMMFMFFSVKNRQTKRWRLERMVLGERERVDADFSYKTALLHTQQRKTEREFIK